jgi:hypothetical protein
MILDAVGIRLIPMILYYVRRKLKQNSATSKQNTATEENATSPDFLYNYND